MSFQIFVAYNIGASHRSIKDNLVFSSFDNKFSFNWDFDSIDTVRIHLQAYFLKWKKSCVTLFRLSFFLEKSLRCTNVNVTRFSESLDDPISYRILFCFNLVVFSVRKIVKLYFRTFISVILSSKWYLQIIASEGIQLRSIRKLLSSCSIITRD